MNQRRGTVESDRRVDGGVIESRPSVMLWPIAARYASPRRFVGWLITLIRRPFLRLVYPVVDDVARQTDSAFELTYAELSALKGWMSWVEEALGTATVAREAAERRLVEQGRRLERQVDEQHVLLDAGLLGVSHRLDDLDVRLDPVLAAMDEQVVALQRRVHELAAGQASVSVAAEDAERRQTERLERVEENLQVSGALLTSGLDALERRLTSVASDLENTTSTQAKFENRVAALSDGFDRRLAAVATDVENTTSAQAKFEDRLAALREDVVHTRTRVGALEDHAEPAIELIRGHLDEVITRIDAVEVERHERTREVERLGELINTVEATQEALRQSVDDLGFAATAREHDVAKVHERLDAFTTDVARQNAGIEEAIRDARVHLESLETSKQDSVERIEQMSRHLTALEDSKQAIGGSVAAIESTMSSTSEGIQDLRERVQEHAVAAVETEQAMQTLRAAAAAQLDDVRHSVHVLSRQVEEVEALRGEIRNLATLRPTEVEALFEPWRDRLETATSALHDQLADLDERVTVLSRDSAPRELLDSVAANAARIDRLEEENAAALVALQRRVRGIPDNPASVTEVADLSERFDRFRTQTFEQIGDLAQSLTGQAERDDARVSRIDAESRRRG